MKKLLWNQTHKGKTVYFCDISFNWIGEQSKKFNTSFSHVVYALVRKYMSTRHSKLPSIIKNTEHLEYLESKIKPKCRNP
jgi:hypothetical protein